MHLFELFHWCEEKAQFDLSKLESLLGVIPVVIRRDDTHPTYAVSARKRLQRQRGSDSRCFALSTANLTCSGAVPPI